MFLKFSILLIFLIILLIIFIFISGPKNISFEYFTPKTLLKGIFITNTVTSKVICIEENGKKGLQISMKDSKKVPSYFSILNLNLNDGSSSDIFKILCANGNYWYFNSNSKYDSVNECSTIEEENTSLGEFIDLSSIPTSQIYQNALFFENGTMITFDRDGEHMILSTVPTNTLQSSQCIFALGSYDLKNLLGNTMILLHSSGEPPKNYFFYNGSCGINSFGNNKKNGINPLETLAIYVPSNQSESILAFSNGCFIDGSLKTFSSGEKSLRFIGNYGVLNFNLNKTYDMFQIWNIPLSNYFYYNYSNQSGVLESSINKYTSGKSYWNMHSSNLLPYVPNLSFREIDFNFIDQILIYDPNSEKNLAILIQVDTNTYFQKKIVPNGANNYAISFSSVIYDKGEIKINKDAVSKFFFNLNSFSESDIIDFNFGKKYLTVQKSKELGLEKNLSRFSLFSNVSTLAFRNKPSNLLVFENNINFKGGTQIGIDKNGNCIWKGKRAQIQLNMGTLENNFNFSIFSFSSTGKIQKTSNNFFANEQRILNPNPNLPLSTVPSVLVSDENSTNIINGKKDIPLLSRIQFSNQINFFSEKDELIMEGFSGSFLTNLNSKKENSILKIQQDNSVKFSYTYS